MSLGCINNLQKGLFLAIITLMFIGAIIALCVTLGGAGHETSSTTTQAISTTSTTTEWALSTVGTTTASTFAMLLLSTNEYRNEF